MQHFLLPMMRAQIWVLSHHQLYWIGDIDKSARVSEDDELWLDSATDWSLSKEICKTQCTWSKSVSVIWLLQWTVLMWKVKFRKGSLPRRQRIKALWIHHFLRSYLVPKNLKCNIPWMYFIINTMNWIRPRSMKHRYSRVSFYKLGAYCCSLLQYMDLCGWGLKDIFGYFYVIQEKISTQSLTMKSESKSWPLGWMLDPLNFG